MEIITNVEELGMRSDEVFDVRKEGELVRKREDALFADKDG